MHVAECAITDLRSCKAVAKILLARETSTTLTPTLQNFDVILHVPNHIINRIETEIIKTINGAERSTRNPSGVAWFIMNGFCIKLKPLEGEK